MANPFVKFWKYLMAAFSSKIDEHADPKVQIQQAIEEAQRQHQALSQQAAAVIGNDLADLRVSPAPRMNTTLRTTIGQPKLASTIAA